ncbi:hypothetical protein BDZ89DRAFT_1035097 [Hymenopellis radicata]|nr:hypothetical protein BDZ89DRAFT_1035097 [Hymenopellis radicata]
MSSTTSGKVFNVVEPTGAERSQFETTAADAQANAPTASAARQVERQADATTAAAHDAAETAQAKGKEFTGEPPSALDNLQRQATDVTNGAVSEGKQDVQAAQATGAGYVDQVKSLAGQAVQTAQQCMPTATGQPGETPTSGAGASDTGNIPTQIQVGAATVLETAKGYISTAQSAAQPHIDKAMEYIQGVQQQSSTAKPGEVSPSTAPLESGQHIGGPYPAADIGGVKKA